MQQSAPMNPGQRAVASSLPALGLSALGVVFGDIGTSPLYTLKTVLALTGPHPDPTATLGALSLVIWTLIVVTSIKYVSFAMRVDNDGEGGILALMSLLGVKRQHRPAIVALGLFGAALIYGDGAITPAISVLSALEGLDIVTLDFAAVHFAGGGGDPDRALRHPAAWDGADRQGIRPDHGAVVPRHGGARNLGDRAASCRSGRNRSARRFAYLRTGGLTSFLVLGGVFLCVTGAEALYADMGHFGAGPIRLAWSAVVFPSLILNYAGQAALVLEGAPTADNIFFRLCPPFMLCRWCCWRRSRRSSPASRSSPGPFR